MATLSEVQPAAATLNNEEILRYSRHLIMPEVGMQGQLKLKAAKVLCIGAGGLGSRWPSTWEPRASALWELWILTWSTTPTCSAKSFTPPET
jgi:hypothetical protein